MKFTPVIKCTEVVTTEGVLYEPTWESIDSRPLPSWYDESKIGIFLHWGVYAVPSFGSEWFWSNWDIQSSSYVDFMQKNYKPGFTYQEFAKEFTAEFFDPADWAKVFKESGAKYVVLTSKHHEGYTLWPSTYSFSWNAGDVGPHRDLVGDLAAEVRNNNMKFGLYHSLYEWFNPMYLADRANNYATDVFVRNKVYPELLEIVHKYKPEIVWSDGEWEAPDTYWKSKEFLAWLYNESPVKDTVVTNDRWGSGGILCNHGGFYTCFDRYNPGVLLSHKWENAMTLDKSSWGYRRNTQLSDYMTIHELLKTLAETVSCGGNILINVGPTKEGTIIPIFRERLQQLGEWLNINGDAIYKSKPWTYQNDTVGTTWYTSKETAVYAITLYWPENNVFRSEKLLELFQTYPVNPYLLGNDEQLQWKIVNDAVEITFPDKATVASQWVWVNCGSIEWHAFTEAMRSILLAVCFLALAHGVIYEPTWESIDSRPLPSWYDEAKIGIFLHWGVYSVPSYSSEWFWIHWKDQHWHLVEFMNKNYKPGFTYQEFAKEFTAEFYDPADWANVFKDAGAKYVILTSKHHDGYTLWPSTYSFSWNAGDVGPHRDLVADLAWAVRQTDMKFGLYHSLYEWFNPMYLSDKANNYATDVFVKNKVLPELTELVNKYEPEIVWSDGEWEAPDTYWQSKEFIAWLYNDSPVKDTVVTNDRWGGNDIICVHGGVHTCHDRYNPGVLQPHKWENAMTIDKSSWSYRRDAKLADYMTIHELLKTLVETVSCGGNILINVGPTKEGTIVPIFRQRLQELGQWLYINGDAIYKSVPWIYQSDPIATTWYTSKDTTVYAITLYWPENNIFKSEKLLEVFQTQSVEVYLLGNNEKLQWQIAGNAVEITFPDKAKVVSEWAWVIKVVQIE
ncbi:hypothetical protein FQA39_LY06341 [Lamprigera yunnana]|nr:hypothetical protein FQA39_LY06341 [Lamprigera yunnana]